MWILSKLSNVITPAIEAFAGLGMPSLIYLSINHDIKLINGWAISSAADIAFTLVILALLGARVPAKLKLLVITTAIFDDIVSIAIIAIFYTKSLSLLSLSLGTLFIIEMIIYNRIFKVNRSSVYVVLGFFAWFCKIKSGVHATLAGFATILCTPFREDDKDFPANFMEVSLHPWIIILYCQFLPLLMLV